VRDELTTSQKESGNYWYAGLSLSFPVMGQLVDILMKSTVGIGTGTAFGTVFALLSFLILQKKPDEPSVSQNSLSLSSRQKAYIFMNKLWQIQETKSKQIHENLLE